MNTITVKTKEPGTICPKEGSPREYITNKPVQVQDTMYYRRLIDEGSLELATAKPKAKTGDASPTIKGDK
jgi:hypothetical protein